MRDSVKVNLIVLVLLFTLLVTVSCGSANINELDSSVPNDNNVGNPPEGSMPVDTDGSNGSQPPYLDGSENNEGSTNVNDGSKGQNTEEDDGSKSTDGSKSDDGSDIVVDKPVLPNPNAILQLDQTELTLQPQRKSQLNVTYVPRFETDDPTLYWESDREDVVKVDQNGNLETLSAGQAIITCTDSSGHMTATCTVTVKLTWENYSYDFKADLSEYEWAMNPESDAYVFLVNKDNPLDKNYAPKDLVDIRDTRTDRSKQKMRRIAEAALHALYLEAKENGILYVHKQSYSDGYYYNNVLSVTSAYRTYNQQANNFNNKVNSLLNANPGMTRAEAEAIAATTINRPGTSEHQSGLCVDMHNYRYAEKEIAEEFGQSVAGQWLAENCYKFGYILRYEADKTDITGIAYESWHFRYVGRYHATRMHELDMCLEEYTKYLAQMGYEFDLSE